MANIRYGCCRICGHLLVLLPAMILCRFPVSQLAAHDGTCNAQQERGTADVAEPKKLPFPGKTLRNGILRLAGQFESAALADPDSVTNHVGEIHISIFPARC